MKKVELRCVALIVLCTMCATLASEEIKMSFDDVIEEILLSDDESTGSSYTLFEQLTELYSNKVDLNAKDLSQLEILPFLDYDLIEKIAMYSYLNGGIKDLSELQLIEGIDFHTRQLLEPFVYVGKTSHYKDALSIGNVLKYGRNELSFKINCPLYMRDGFRQHSAEELQKYPNRQYYGNRYSHSLRYQFSYYNKLKLGFTADQDAGDPFFGPNRMGYDFYTPYLMVNDIGFVKNLCVGNMKVGFGQGLILGNGFGTGKSNLTTSLNRQMNSLKIHSGTAEFGYFTGVGAVTQFGKYYLTGVISRSFRDATLNSDGTIKSFKTDGYHRTILEYSKRHNVQEDMTAMHFMRNSNGINIGATIMYDAFTRGNKMISYSADYSIKRGKFTSGGEIAYSGDGYAVIDNFMWRLSGKTQLVSLFRYYQEGFSSYHSMTSIDGSNSGVKGLYLGMKTEVDYFNLSGYVDGRECQFESLFYKRRSDKYLLRLKYKNNDDKRTARMKFRYDHQSPSGVYAMQSQLNAVASFSDGESSYGLSLSHVSDFTFKEGAMKLSISACGFLTENYDRRISIYEKGLLYSFGFLTLYGKGLRSSVLFKYKVSDALTLTIKAGSTKYFDRDVIGSSQQKISASHKEDLEFQLRLKL